MAPLRIRAMNSPLLPLLLLLLSQQCFDLVMATNNQQQGQQIQNRQERQHMKKRHQHQPFIDGRTFRGAASYLNLRTVDCIHICRGGSKSAADKPSSNANTNTTELQTADSDASGDIDKEAASTAESTNDGSQSLADDISTDNDATAIADKAIQLRLEGKEFHESGEFVKAAQLYEEAADAIQAFLQNQEHANQNPRLAGEYTTCRLHQALCHLKSRQFEECAQACTDVLGDDDAQDTKSYVNPAVNTPVFRARAYYRRAKARLGLGDSVGALEDARLSAFLGYKKGVALYGELIRGSPLFASPGQAPLDQILHPGSSPSPMSSGSNLGLLESLLSKGQPGDSSVSPFSAASMLLGNKAGDGDSSKSGGLLGGLGSSSSEGSALAKSVLKSLSKRMDDESTHETISNLLQTTDRAKLRQLVAMAGASNVLNDSHLDRIVSICHGATPKRIRRTVKTTKGFVYVVQVLRRIGKIFAKYKTFFIAIFLLQWTKSACLRPIPIDHRAAKRAAKRALGQAMKESRTP